MIFLCSQAINDSKQTYILNSSQLYSSNAQCHACFIAYIGCRQTVSENDARLKNVNSVLPLNGMTCNNGVPSVKPPPPNSARAPRQDLRTARH